MFLGCQNVKGQGHDQTKLL